MIFVSEKKIRNRISLYKYFIGINTREVGKLEDKPGLRKKCAQQTAKK